MRDLSAALRNQPPAEHAYDWDPLHMPGLVQSYGVLIVADKNTRQVHFVSENALEVLGIPASDIMDRSYLALCEQERERRAMKDAITPDGILFPNPMRVTLKGRAFDAVVHSHAGFHFIEMEAVAPDDAPYADMAEAAVEDLHDPGSIDDLYQRAVRVVRRVTGFDRVMLYRFDARYNGQVLAESAQDGIGSFLGLFFPSGDISGRARELYLKNFTRYIPDIGAPSHRMLGPQGSAAPDVDMTHSNLRSVAPCHIGYLRNMGVKASMSFSINVDNRLWGLFACHHYAPRRVSYEQRVVCEQTAMMFIYKLTGLTSVAARMAQRSADAAQIVRGLQIGAALTRRIAAMDGSWSEPDDEAAARPILMRALAAIQAETNWLLTPEPPFRTEASTADHIDVTPAQRILLDLVEADSAAVVRHGQVRRIGDAPSEMAVFAIASMFGRELPDLQKSGLPVFATDNLSGMAPVAASVKDRAAGVLAVALSDETPAYLMWFRREQIVHAAWAGNPGDEAQNASSSATNPRASFAAWKADIRDLSKTWVLEDIEIAFELMSAIRAADGAPLSKANLPLSTTARTWASVPTPTRAADLRQEPASLILASAPAQHGRRVIRVGQL